ncbi:GNAT family N-acetyltransferase [Chryseobacterium sp. T1]
MFPIIKTSRLILNKIELSDADTVFFLKSNPEVMRYIKRDPYTEIEQAVNNIKLISSQLEAGESVNWALRDSETKEMMGSISLWNFSKNRKTAEMGYAMKPDFHGNGYMDEAMKAVVNYGFEELNLDLIEAFTSRYNESSKKLLLKNHFVHNPSREDEDNLDNFIFELKKEQ